MKLHERPPVGRGRSLWEGVEKMIVVARDGTVLQGEALSQEQKEAAVVMIFRSFISQHPEVLQTGGQAAAEPSTSPV